MLLTGATGGLGTAIARALGERGAALLLSGRRVDVLEPLAAELGARSIACDLADPADVDRLAAAGVEAGVQVFVANAAIPAGGRAQAYDVEALDRALAVNLRAPMVLAKRLSEAMTARGGGGHIVFVNSLSGKAASPGGSLYSATKFGLRGFALGLREDLRDEGIGVSTVFPSFIRDAGMFHDSGAKLPAYIRTRSPADVAAAVIAAIERDRAEVDVAPLTLRAGATAASLAPQAVAAVQRRLGGSKVSDSITEGQRDKR